MYVTVHGHLKGFQGKKQMMVYSIRYGFITFFLPFLSSHMFPSYALACLLSFHRESKIKVTFNVFFFGFYS